MAIYFHSDRFSLAMWNNCPLDGKQRDRGKINGLVGNYTAIEPSQSKRL